MDSLTHLVAGGLTPLAFRHAPRRVAIVFFGIIAGEFPDVDALFSSGTPEGIMVIHRALTHSLVWQPILMLCFVLPFFIYLYCSKKTAVNNSTYTTPSLKLLCCMALVALYIHLYLDSVTTFGTQIFLPFSPLRVALPGMFIVDLFILIPTGILFITALLYKKHAATPSRCFSDRTRFLARCGLAWILIYPLCSLGINTYLSHTIATKEHITSSHVRMLTEPFSPFVWKQIVEEQDTYTMNTFFLFQDNDKRVTAQFDKPNQLLLKKVQAKIPLFSIYTSFATCMVQEERKASFTEVNNNIATVYVFKDLRYIGSPEAVLQRLGSNFVPFVFEVGYNTHGEIQGYRFLDSMRNTKTIWNYL